MKKMKINIVDVGVLLLIILMVVAIHTRFQKYNTVDSSEASLNKIVYTIKINSVRDFTVDAFQVGDAIYDSQTNVLIGTIIGKEAKEYENYSALMDGTVVKRVQPERYELTLEIETDGIVNNAGYYANKTVELKVGSEKAVETLYAKSSGRIASIEVK